MHKRTLIKNATIVNEGRAYLGSMVIDNDRIEDIMEGRDCEPLIPADEVVEAEGLYLLPGVIDDHVHFRDPGLTSKADFDTESRAALAGGVTTVLDMPNTIPPTSTKDTLREKIALAQEKCRVNYGFFFGATSENAEELRNINKRKVCGIKLFMGSSTGNLQVEDGNVLRTIFEQSRLPIMVHCEDTQMVDENMQICKERYGDDPDVMHHSDIRSEEACYKSTLQAVQLAHETGARLHVAHVSTAKELQLFTPGDARITAEVCLPHLLFTDADYARLGTRIKCNPAVKTEKDRAALRRALVNGTVRTIGTDHAPHTLKDKEGGAARAASGIPMVQFSLVSMLELVDQGVLPVERLVQLMCHNPAELFHIENRGYLRPGYKADLVLLRPHAPWTLTPNRILSKCNWSPMEGHTFGWRVEKTYCNGFLAYNGGQITDEDLHGQMITFTPR